MAGSILDRDTFDPRPFSHGVRDAAADLLCVQLQQPGLWVSEQTRILRPESESVLSPSSIEQEKTAAPKIETVERKPDEHFWFPLALIVRLRAFESLRFRDYRLLWYSQVFASLGVWMDQVTRGWLIYELTDSALQLGLVRGIQAVPFLFLSPIAGSVADRYPRKFLVVTAQFANGFIFTATAALDSLWSHSAVACLSDGCAHGLCAGISCSPPGPP